MSVESATHKITHESANMTTLLTDQYDIQSFLDELNIYSTHEHLRYEHEAINRVVTERESVLSLFGTNYPVTDFRSVGATEEEVLSLRSNAGRYDERHNLLLKYAKRCRNTTQFKALHRALADLYEGDVLDCNSAKEMDARRREQHDTGVYHSVLVEKAGIQLMCRDCGPHFKEEKYFRTAVRMEEWFGICSWNDVQRLSAATAVPISNFDQLILAFRREAERMIDNGAVAFKNAWIYRRDPSWRLRSKAEAESCFQKAQSTMNAEWVVSGDCWRADLFPLQDFLLGELCDLAAEKKVPLQVHTGIPEGNVLPLEWGKPTKFTDLVRSFPKLDIHLLHVGHPYEQEAISMAKLHPNVTLDCSWFHQLNAHAAQFFTNWMLDEVPVWKILGFGGDYGHMEGVYGHWLQARQNLTIAMTNRIGSGQCSKQEAYSTLSEILYENPKRTLYRRS